MHKNVNCMIPQPFAGVHDTLVRRFTAARKGRYMKATSPVFVQMRSGYIRLSLLGLHEMMSTSAAQGPRYVGVLASVKSSSEFLLVRARVRARGGAGPIPARRECGLRRRSHPPAAARAPQADEHGLVTAMSEGAALSLNIALDSVREREHSVASLFPAAWDDDKRRVVEGSRVIAAPASATGRMRLTATAWQGQGYCVTVLELRETKERLTDARAARGDAGRDRPDVFPSRTASDGDDRRPGQRRFSDESDAPPPSASLAGSPRPKGFFLGSGGADPSVSMHGALATAAILGDDDDDEVEGGDEGGREHGDADDQDDRHAGRHHDHDEEDDGGHDLQPPAALSGGRDGDADGPVHTHADADAAAAAPRPWRPKHKAAIAADRASSGILVPTGAIAKGPSARRFAATATPAHASMPALRGPSSRSTPGTPVKHAMVPVAHASAAQLADAGDTVQAGDVRWPSDALLDDDALAAPHAAGAVGTIGYTVGASEQRAAGEPIGERRDTRSWSDEDKTHDAAPLVRERERAPMQLLPTAQRSSARPLPVPPRIVLAGAGNERHARDDDHDDRDSRDDAAVVAIPHVRTKADMADADALDDTDSRHSKSHASGSRNSSSRASSIGIRTVHALIKVRSTRRARAPRAASQHRLDHDARAAPGPQHPTPPRRCQRMNAGLDPELLRLQRLIAGLLLLFTALLLGVVAVSDVFLRAWYEDVSHVRLSERRIAYAATIGIDTDTLHFEANGLRSADAAAFARRRLLTVTHSLEDTRYALMRTASQQSMTEMLPIREWVGGQLLPSPANQWTATIDLATRAEMLRLYPAQIFNVSQSHVGSLRPIYEEMLASSEYIEHNLLDVIVPALRDSSAIYDKEAQDAIQFVELLLYVATGLAMVPLLLSVVFAYGPAIMRNEGGGAPQARAHVVRPHPLPAPRSPIAAARRRAALTIFLKVPTAMFRERVAVCQAAITEFLGEDEVDDEDDKDVDARVRSPRAAALRTRAHRAPWLTRHAVRRRRPSPGRRQRRRRRRSMCQGPQGRARLRRSAAARSRCPARG